MPELSDTALLAYHITLASKHLRQAARIARNKWSRADARVAAVALALDMVKVAFKTIQRLGGN